MDLSEDIRMEIHPKMKQESSSYWKFWPTIGLSAIIGIIALLGQIIFGFGWGIVVWLTDGNIDVGKLAENGNFILGCSLFSQPIALGFMFLCIKLRSNNSLGDYLALKKTKRKQIGVWAGWFLVVMVLMEGATALLNQPPPASMVMIYKSSSLWLVLITIILVAPVAEELFFRGFMFTGIAASKAGAAGAVALSTIFWSGLHVQYGWLGLLYITLLGIVLGMARLKTGSIIAPLILHIANNAISTVWLMIFIERGLV
jgi:membrane protease YdiL (CAAX protease family)